MVADLRLRSVGERETAQPPLDRDRFDIIQKHITPLWQDLVLEIVQISRNGGRGSSDGRIAKLIGLKVPPSFFGVHESEVAGSFAGSVLGRFVEERESCIVVSGGVEVFRVFERDFSFRSEGSVSSGIPGWHEALGYHPLAVEKEEAAVASAGSASNQGHLSL